MRGLITVLIMLTSLSAFGRLKLPKQLLCSFPDGFKVLLKPKVEKAGSDPASVEVTILKDGQRLEHYSKLDIVPGKAGGEVDFNLPDTFRVKSVVSVTFGHTNNRGEFYADFWPRISTGWCSERF